MQSFDIFIMKNMNGGAGVKFHTCREYSWVLCCMRLRRKLLSTDTI